MKKIVFDFDPQKCSACGACAIACMDQNDVDVEAGMQPYRKVYEYESATERVYISIACLHCPDAPCVTACPVGCIYNDQEHHCHQERPRRHRPLLSGRLRRRPGLPVRPAGH